MSATEPRLRTDVHARDVAAVRDLVAAAGNFSAQEIAIAGELVEERLTRGPASGYEFFLADGADALAGYACYGPIPGTIGRYDLYWIAVRPDVSHQGLGTRLLAAVEHAVRDAGGTRIYVDTSTGPTYAAARGFYARMGYARAAELPDFYFAGEGKVIFVKVLA